MLFMVEVSGGGKLFCLTKYLIEFAADLRVGAKGG